MTKITITVDINHLLNALDLIDLRYQLQTKKYLMKSIYKIAFLVVVFISMANSCVEQNGRLSNDNSDTLIQDMVDFDKAYIPVLYYVRKGELDHAKRAVFYLNHSWQRVNKRYKYLYPQNDDWQEGFRMTDNWLSDAYNAIDGVQPNDAFIFMDHVRYQFIELRFQNKMNYFLDDVWDLEASLDLVEEVAVDHMLCLLEYCEFEELVSDLNESWRTVRKNKIDKGLFDFDKNQSDLLKVRTHKFEIALLDLNQAVEVAEGEDISIAAALLTEAYLEYLYCFGDFISSKHYYAAL